MKAYIEEILIPYVSKKGKELKLPSDYPALAIFDKFTGQGTQGLLQFLEDNDIRVVMVPANCTDRLQPLDVSVNKPAKLSCGSNSISGMLKKSANTSEKRQLSLQ